MTQARRPPESRARDRLGRLCPPPAPPCGPRTRHQAKYRAGRAAGRRAIAGSRGPGARGARSLGVTSGPGRLAGRAPRAPRGEQPGPRSRAALGAGAGGVGPRAGRRRARVGREAFGAGEALGAAPSPSVSCEGSGDLCTPPRFQALPPRLEGAPGSEPDRRGVELPQRQGRHYALTHHP